MSARPSTSLIVLSWAHAAETILSAVTPCPLRVDSVEKGSGVLGLVRHLSICETAFSFFTYSFVMASVGFGYGVPPLMQGWTPQPLMQDRPSVSFKPRRNASKRSAYTSGESAPSNPMTGIVCCARDASGQAIATAPRTVISSRRCMWLPGEDAVQCLKPSTFRRGRCAINGPIRAHGSIRPDVAGSIATEMGCPCQYRFSPDSDRTADITGGPVRANNRSRQTTFVGGGTDQLCG